MENDQVVVQAFLQTHGQLGGQVVLHLFTHMLHIDTRELLKHSLI